MKLFGFNITLARKYDRDGHAAMGHDDDGHRGGKRSDADEFHRLQEYLKKHLDRKKRLDLYEKMDDTEVVAIVADTYAEDATGPMAEIGKKVAFKCENDNIRKALMDMSKQTALDELAFPIVRHMCVYGDDFERLVYATGHGIRAMQYANVKEVQRHQDRYGRLEGFEQQGQKFKNPESKDGKISYPWDYLHFRLFGKHRASIYGTSIFHHTVRPWKQLMLAEDEQLFYRLNRRPDRDAWFIDVGTSDEVEAWKIVKRFERRYKRHTFADPEGGSYDHQFNPLTPNEDIFLPLREGSQTRYEKMSGNPDAGDVRDIQFFLDKFFSTTGLPKEMFGMFTDNSGIQQLNPRQGYTTQSIRYARAVQRVQEAFKFGIRDMAEIHLALLDPNPESSKYNWRLDGQDFQVVMEPVSYLVEFNMLDLMNLRMSVAQSMAALFPNPAVLNERAWVKYIMTDVLQMPEAKAEGFLKSASDIAKAQDQFQFAHDIEAMGNAASLTEEHKDMVLHALKTSPELREAVLQTKLLMDDSDIDNIRVSRQRVPLDTLKSQGRMEDALA